MGGKEIKYVDKVPEIVVYDYFRHEIEIVLCKKTSRDGPPIARPEQRRCSNIVTLNRRRARVSRTFSPYVFDVVRVYSLSLYIYIHILRIVRTDSGVRYIFQPT